MSDIFSKGEQFEDESDFTILTTPRTTWREPVFSDDIDKSVYFDFVDQYEPYLESHMLPNFADLEEKEHYMQALFDKPWNLPIPWMNGGMGTDLSHDGLVNAVLDSRGIGTLSGMASLGDSDVYEELYDHDDQLRNQLSDLFAGAKTPSQVLDTSHDVHNLMQDVLSADQVRDIFARYDTSDSYDELYHEHFTEQLIHDDYESVTPEDLKASESQDSVLWQTERLKHSLIKRFVREARVARRGGVVSNKDYYQQKNKDVYSQRIQSVREQHPNGIVAVNLMRVVDDFEPLLDHIAEIGRDDPHMRTDIVFVGAGMDRHLGRKMEKYPHMRYGVIVDSARGARLAGLGGKNPPSVLYIENPKSAGGHLGLNTEFDQETVLQEIRALKGGENIPVIFAGGVNDSEDVETAYESGYDGVALGTRMLVTQESAMSDDLLKDFYLNDEYPILTGKLSPTGFSSRYIENPEFLEAITQNIKSTAEKCVKCINLGPNKCGFLDEDFGDSYCIARYLGAARQGRTEGLLFTGSELDEIRKNPLYKDADGEQYVPKVHEVRDQIFGAVDRILNQK
jgi:NAD(P)H-dependent flavin oxidoreductase YrpB (nitropropane dioxygenase family)